VTAFKRRFADSLGVVLRSKKMKRTLPSLAKRADPKAKRVVLVESRAARLRRRKMILAKSSAFRATSLGIMLLNALTGRKGPRRTK